MTVTVGDILGAVDLDLKWVSGPTASLTTAVRWTAITELADCGRFLSGGELVLTTGLRQTDAASQRAFVREIAAAGATALGFGTGLTHPTVPEATVAAAHDLGLPVLEVPYGTPFLAVDRFVADRVLADQYGRQQRLLASYDALSAALLAGAGLPAMTAELSSAIGAPVAVIGASGEIIAAAPPRSSWPVDQILAHTRQAGPASAVNAMKDDGTHTLPVIIDEATVAYLVARRPRVLADVLPFAVGLIGLEVARQQAVLAGRRELLAQVLDDIVHGAVPDTVAATRLATFDIDIAKPNAVVLGQVIDRTDDVVRRAAAAPLPHPDTVTAWLGGVLAAVVRGGGGGDVPEIVSDHLQHASGHVAVGVGGAYEGVAGLRWSYYEANHSLHLGPGIHQRPGFSIAGALLATEDVPLADLAQDALAPLVSHDRAHDSGLVDTLRTYLECDCSVGAAAQRLFLHRNTIRYRLDAIRQVAGRGVDTTADRTHWYLALLASEEQRRSP